MLNFIEVNRWNYSSNLGVIPYSKRTYIWETKTTPIELNNYTEESWIAWNYLGSGSVTCNGEEISSCVGFVIILPNLEGCTQLYFDYRYGSLIKIRTQSANGWSKWYQYEGTESTL